MSKIQKPNRREVDDAQDGDDAIIGSALRWSAIGLVVVAVLGGAVAFVLNRPEPAPASVEAEVVTPQVRTLPKLDPPTVRFRDVTEAAGIDFVHENGAYGDKLLPETMGGGCAFFDFDGDDDQDLLLVNSAQWPWDPNGRRTRATPALYRNDGQGAFENVTEAVGLDVSVFGMGAAVADYDNDGDPDVFLSAVGQDQLLRNDGGKFTNVTEAAGVQGGDTDWSTSCCWFDYDKDGWLDLFVCQYIRWTREIDIAQDFRLVGVGRAYGPPSAFDGAHNRLFRNRQDGTFEDVSASAGIEVSNSATGVAMAKSLGVSPIDLDQDGWMDLVVANDTVQNFLFHNQGDGTFLEIGALAGIAFDSEGQARGAMGTDAAYPHNDQTLAVAVGNFANEMTAFYCSHDVPLQFADTAIANGLGPPTRLALTFGLFFFDYDMDGRLDLLCANGHLEEEINKVQVSQHYAQPPQLFWNCGRETRTEFIAVSPQRLGSDFHQAMVGRGAAFADIDGDGDLDALITAVGAAPRLLRNEQQLGHHWLRFKLTAKSGNRDAIGAWVEVDVNGATMRRQVMPTRSYLSQCELPVTFGLGEAASVEAVRVVWPNGNVQVVEVGDQVDRLIEVTES